MIESMTAYVLAAMAMAWTLTSPIMGITPKPIAVAIATASNEKPLFEGEDGPRRTAALMTAVARYETGFRQIAGDCKDKPPGWPGCGKEEGSKPTSWCFLQIHFGDGVERVQGYTSDELMADPLKCARAGREIMRDSAKNSPKGEPLLMYAGRSGPARLRFELAQKLFKLVPWTVRCD